MFVFFSAVLLIFPLFRNFNCRKRSRDEDSCDFMPISKRINSLSINNPFVADNNIAAIIQQPEPSALGYDQTMMNNIASDIYHPLHQHAIQAATLSNNNSYPDPLSNNNYFHTNNNYMAHGRLEHHGDRTHNGNGGDPSVGQQQHLHQEYMTLESYNPELTQDENPFYYNKNKLLFDLHIERERRSSSTQ